MHTIVKNGFFNYEVRTRFFFILGWDRNADPGVFTEYLLGVCDDRMFDCFRIYFVLQIKTDRRVSCLFNVINLIKHVLQRRILNKKYIHMSS